MSAFFSISQIIVAANGDEFDEKGKAPVVRTFQSYI